MGWGVLVLVVLIGCIRTEEEEEDKSLTKIEAFELCYLRNRVPLPLRW